MSDITILIVDDEPTILASMSKILAPEYRVRAANSGFRALEVAKSEPRPALILLDSMMPDMDGYTVLSLLKKNVATRDIPVIFVTGMKTVADEEKGLRLGAVDYITKPINPSILLARVKTHYDTAKARKLLMQLMSLLKVDDAAASELFGESKNLLINAYGPIVEILGQQIMKLDNKAALITLKSIVNQNDTKSTNLAGLILGDRVGSIDPGALSKIFKNTKVIIEFMNKFIPMADGAISNIITACEERNADKVNFNSHKLKSSARTVGANELASICLELEVAGKNSDWDSINELYEKLIPAMNQVKDYINKL